MLSQQNNSTDLEPPSDLPAGRTIHLIDLENLMARTDVTQADAAMARDTYMRTVLVRPGDLVVIATSHYVARNAWFGWKDARRLVGSGPDGADLALLQVIATENLEGRFDNIVVASGDGIFAGACAQLQAAGCHVTVVSRPEALSRRLAFAVRDVLQFGVPSALVPVSALIRQAA